MLQEQSIDTFLDAYLGSSEGKQEKEYIEAAKESDERERYEEGIPVPAPIVPPIRKGTWMSMISLLILAPATIFFGIYFMGDRKYYFISLMLILYALIPFLINFEGRRPKAREVVLIASLSAITVASRAAFFMLPQFKPMAALIIISGVCLGGEAGFLVGAVSALVSNFFFGQGPWTPWQMFAFGMIGYFAGVFRSRGWLSTKRIALSIYGFFTVLLVYGFVMNTASLFMFSQSFTKAYVLSVYFYGIPMDMVHGAATVFFLMVASKPMIEKIERIKIKYGLG